MRNLVPSFSTSFHPSSFLPPSFAFVIFLSSLDFYPLSSPFHFYFALLSSLPFVVSPVAKLFSRRGWWRLRYFFIMHTFTEAIAISFGLVSVLSAGKSISTVAEHREPKEKERKIERESGWSRGNLSGRKSRAAINSPLKRNRSGTF